MSIRNKQRRDRDRKDKFAQNRRPSSPNGSSIQSGQREQHWIQAGENGICRLCLRTHRLDTKRLAFLRQVPKLSTMPRTFCVQRRSSHSLRRSALQTNANEIAIETLLNLRPVNSARRRSGKGRDCIKHLDRRRRTLALRGEIKTYGAL
jgi:hypothetical protein